MIQANVRKVFSDIEETCRKINRNPQDITVVGVTKMVALEVVQEAIDAGIRHIAENRVIEAESKFPQLVSVHTSVEQLVYCYLVE